LIIKKIKNFLLQMIIIRLSKINMKLILVILVFVKIFLNVNNC